jgi:DNA-binding transcriptional LysR family regulator
MAKKGKIKWDEQIGRSLRLRDLHVLQSVAQHGSMVKAAAFLKVSQPAVSEVISDIEKMLHVDLFERTAQGVAPTAAGHALLRRSIVAFDELKQGIREIESLRDPAGGVLRIGSVESIASSILPEAIQTFSHQYPRAVITLDQITTPSLELPRLRDRNLDIVLARIRALRPADSDLQAEFLFDDRVIIAAGAQTKWAKRRKIDLAELVDEPWTMLPPHEWNIGVLETAFTERGLTVPKASVLTFSVHMRAHLVASGRFISVFPKSMLHFYANRSALKALPVDMPDESWPVAVVTLKNRNLNPVALRFIDHLREITKSITW